jgi:hypothetical protein
LFKPGLAAQRCRPRIVALEHGDQQGKSSGVELALRLLRGALANILAEIAAREARLYEVCLGAVLRIRLGREEGQAQGDNGDSNDFYD